MTVPRRPAIWVRLTMPVLLMAACTQAPPPASAPPPTTAPPTTASLPEGLCARDVSYMEAYHQLLQSHGPGVWPGWGSPPPPLLQRGSRAEYLVGHPDPPAPFVVTGAAAGADAIWEAPAGSLTPGPQATTWRVGAVWSAMVPLRPIFEEAVEAALGPDAVDWNDATYLRVLFHESFHAFQMGFWPEGPPYSTEIDEAGAVAALRSWGDIEAAYAREGEALRRALLAPSIDLVRSHTRDFLNLRAARRRGLAPEVAAFEQGLEALEGTARYADLLMAEAAAGTDGGVLDLGTPGSLLAPFVEGLRDPAPRPDGLRGRWQDLGAAQCLVLERLAPEWKHRLLEEGLPPDTLLAEVQGHPMP